MKAKILLRSIRKTPGRFLSLIGIVALGCGFMAGLSSASPDMYESCDSYMDERNMHDIEVLCSVGFGEEEREQVLALPGVEDAEIMSRQDMLLVRGQDSSYTARVFSLTDRIDLVAVSEGRLPEKDDECVIAIASGKYLSDAPEIGDTLVISSENEDYSSLASSYASDRFTVTGIVTSPVCYSVSPESTDIGSGSIGLTVFIPRSAAPETAACLLVTLEGAREMDAFSDEYLALLASQKDEITSTLMPCAMERGRDLLEKLDQAKSLLTTVAEKEAQMASSGAAALSDFAKVASLFPDCTLFPTQAASASAIPLLEEYDDTAAALLDPTLIVRTREDNTGYDSYKSNVGKVAALAIIFPGFFFLIALLVSLTTMTRLIQEDRGEIGTLRSLGCSRASILRRYLIYSLVACVIGAAAGLAIGCRLFPAAIASAYSMLYTLPDPATPIRWGTALLSFAVMTGSIVTATYFACRATLRETPASLLLPLAPPAGKKTLPEKLPFIWNRLSFSAHMTLRNLFRYKKRLFMTLIGAAGCSALLLTGFGIQDSVNDIVDRQFGGIYRYSFTCKLKEASGTDDLPIDTAMFSDYMAFSTDDGKVEYGTSSDSLTLVVPRDASRLSDFIVLCNRASGNAITLSDGLVLTEKLASSLGVQAGDTLTLEDGSGHRATVTLSAIAENYVGSYGYLSPETWTALFGTEPDFTLIHAVLADGVTGDNAVRDALTYDEVLYATSTASLRDTFNDSVKSLNNVVIVLIIAAGLLSVVVLYNLTNVNICERKRELATLRVLGCHRRETARYIFRETDLLSFLGSLLGLPVGILLHSFVIRTVEVDEVMFGRTIHPLSYLLTLAFSVLFTFIVNRLLRRSVDKVDMIDAMKAID